MRFLRCLLVILILMSGCNSSSTDNKNKNKLELENTKLNEKISDLNVKISSLNAKILVLQSRLEIKKIGSSVDYEDCDVVRRLHSLYLSIGNSNFTQHESLKFKKIDEACQKCKVDKILKDISNADRKDFESLSNLYRELAGITKDNRYARKAQYYAIEAMKLENRNEKLPESLVIREKIYKLEQKIRTPYRYAEFETLKNLYVSIGISNLKPYEYEAFKRVDQIWGTLREKKLLREVRNIPSSDVDKNYLIYKELYMINQKQSYLKKFKYYEEIKEKERMKSISYNIGTWRDTTIEARFHIFYKKGIYYLSIQPDFGQGKDFRLTKDKEWYIVVDGESGDKFKINSSGNLVAYDKDGFIDEYKPFK